MKLFIITLIITLCLYLIIIWLVSREEQKENWLHNIKDIKPTTVTCEDCKCEIKEENAYKVKVGRKYIDISPNWYYTKHDKSSDPFYYCKRCKPTFSRIELELDCEYYYKELEVTKDGEPVGYKKK